MESTSHPSVLLIFVKNLEKGKVKTRLAKSVGDERALEIYKKLLHHTCTQIVDIEVDKQLWYAWYIPKEPICNAFTGQQKKQQGVSLGGRMEYAFKKSFENGYKKAVIIGSDCAALTTKHINEAYKKLSHTDVVIGPATDGGYYLLGMSRFIPEVFSNVEWSSSTVFKKTTENVETAGYKWTTLPPLSDVDTIEDWQKHAHHLK